MTLRPGTNLLRAIILLAALTPIAFFWSRVTLVLVTALFVLAVLAELDRRQFRAAFKQLALRREMPVVVGRDLPFTVRLQITNHNDVPIQGEIRDELPQQAVPRLAIYPLHVPARGATEHATTLRIPRRGRHAFGPVWIRVQGRRRLLEAHQQFECPGTISILPETFATRDQFQKDVGADLRLLDRMQRSRQYGAGTEFESLHPFRFGDDPRRIDWRATARQSTLVVRRFQIERHRDVMIIVDSGRLMGSVVGSGSKLDCAVDAGLNLARVVLASGDRCGVAAYDRQVRGFLPPVAGVSALRSLVDCLYDLQTQWHESDFTPMLAELRARQAKRTFLIVISDLADAETSQRLCASLCQLQRQHLVVFAALQTPLVRSIVRAPIQSERDGAKKAVAFRLLRDRGRALHTLTRNGVHVLDVEPRHLTAPLINQFMELRQRNLL